jgi:hypothetical protein
MNVSKAVEKIGKKLEIILEKDENNNAYARVFKYQIFIINPSKINELRSKYYFNIKNELEPFNIKNINDSDILYNFALINPLHETYITYQQLFT